jgi:hypothetical protein
MCNPDATRHQRQKKADLQSIVKDYCKHQSVNPSKKLLQLLIKVGDWKTKPVSFQAKEENNYTLYQC